MAKRAALSTAWITAGLQKLSGRFATVVCFETDDPERLRQFYAFLSGRPMYGRHQLYRFDRWRGLCRWEPSRGVFVSVALQQDQADFYPYRCELGPALRYLDGVLRSQPTFLVLADLEASNEHEQDSVLPAALRAWSYDPELFARGSAVFLFASRLEAVVDTYTAQRAAVVPVDLSLDTERAFVIFQMVRELGLDEGLLHQVGRLVRLTAGLTLHQLRTVLLECWQIRQTLEAAEIARLKATLMQREDIVEILEPLGGFETVGGYEAVKEFVRHNIIHVLGDPERAAQFGVPLPRGLLLFGPPGTGKSLFAKALAGETNLPFINFKTENLYSEYLGSSGKNFAKAIAIAEKHSPALVFIDEIDRLGKRRGVAGDSAGEETRRVYNQVLEWLGDPRRQSILVGTTNRPEDLDPALLRSGRLDYKIPFLYPDRKARQQILRIHLGLTGVRPPLPVPSQAFLEEAIQMLVAQTSGFSGAELEDLANRIRRRAFQRGASQADLEDFQGVLENFAIDQAARQQEIAYYLRYARKVTNDASLLQDCQD